MERSQELYHHPSPLRLRQKYRRMLWRSHSPSGSMSLPLTLLLEVRQQEIVGKRLVIGQKICYHTRVKSQGESGVSRHSPDPPQPAWTRVERIQQLSVFWEDPGKSASIRCHVTSHPFLGVGALRRKECAYEAVLLS